MADYYFRDRCRMCDGTSLAKVMTLESTPPGNNFLQVDEISHTETVYPLELYLCSQCTHVQLGHVVDPSILYRKSYNYVSGTSPAFVRHLRDYASDMIRRFSLVPDDLVVDIGSNDGTCLQGFRTAGMNVLGIDPAPQIAERATAAGVPTVCEFFSIDLAERLRAKHGPASFITSHNTCAHIDRLDDVFRAVNHWLDYDGVFVLEVGYFLDVYQNSWFDTIYHEHLDYHTVRPFEALLSRIGMELFRVERVSPQGGSIRLFTQRANGPHKADDSISSLVALERHHQLDRPETFIRFRQRIDEVGVQLKSIVSGLIKQGKSIAAFGAPTKSTTLLTHFKLARNEVDFIVDDNPLKHGLFSPLLHIPVLNPAELYRRRSDYLLILAWNFAEQIMTAHAAYLERGGGFILPMPVPRIVDRHNASKSQARDGA